MKVCLNPSNGSHTAVKRVISSRSPGTSEKPGAAVVGVKIPVATSFVENDVVPAAFLTRPPYIFDQRPARRSASVSVTGPDTNPRSEEHTSELTSLNSTAKSVLCL